MPQTAMPIPPIGQRDMPPSARGAPSGHPGKGRYAVFVYAAYCKGYAKIGITEDPKARIRGMQSGCPFPIEILMAVPLNKEQAITAERAIMLELNAAHWCGEWFKCSRGQASYAVERGVKQFQESPAPISKADEWSARRRPYRAKRATVTPEGVFGSVMEAARHHGISRQAAHLRLVRGFPGWAYAK